MAQNPLAEFENYSFHNVLPGHFKITTRDDEVISTLLGSCVAACLRCSRTGIGGLNHFLLPSTRGRDVCKDQSMRYGDFAMEKLIGSIIRSGGHRDSLEVKVFGGANLYDTDSKKTIGRSNIQFVLDFVHSEGISLLAEDIGGTSGRKIYYHPASGKVKVQTLNKQKEQDLKASERNYGHKLDNEGDSGTIELFG
ncbi:MAG: chemoreceptor glutamine deamidase CheD [Pseudomonadota bacterium]